MIIEKLYSVKVPILLFSATLQTKWRTHLYCFIFRSLFWVFLHNWLPLGFLLIKFLQLVLLAFLAIRYEMYCHCVWKSQKKSHSILQAKRATFTKFIKMPSMVNLASFWYPKAWDQLVLLDSTKILKNDQIQKNQMGVIFNQCVKVVICKGYFSLGISRLFWPIS